MKEERLLPVGTKVFDVRYGWGEIEGVYTNETYPYITRFYALNNETSYTLDGKAWEENLNPLLSLTEYTLEKGGFTPISEYWNKPKIGDWGYFWDRESDNVAVFGRLVNIETRNFGVENSGRWHNFSHDIPDHIKKQMEQK